MPIPAQLDIYVTRQEWYVESFVFEDLDLTGSTFDMQVRAVKDTTGTPLLDLTNAAPGLTGINLAYAGTDTIANHIAAGRLSEVPDKKNPTTNLPYALSDNLLLSHIVISVAANLIAAIPFPAELGDDWVGWQNFFIDTPAGVPQVSWAGKFVVLAGVTIP